MPLQKLALRPGINRENTSYANEGGWYEAEKIRFRSGQPEKLGGWVRDTGTVSSNVATVATYGTAYPTTMPTPPSGTLWGYCRSMWNWTTLAGNNLLSFGTNLKFYIQNGPDGSYYDITPIRKISTAVANAFTTNFPTNTTTVRVNDPGHGSQTGDFVTITATSGAVNGIPAATLGTTAAPVMYQITYIDNNSYNITVATGATSAGTSAVTATFSYEINSGNDIYSVATGWGAGGWGGSAGPSAATTINGGTAVTAVSTTPITVVSTTGFAASGTIYIDTEGISYTAVTATTFQGTITRGAGGTTPAAHADGSSVYQYPSTATGWGLAAAFGGVGTGLRFWSESNFGENLIFNPNGGGIYLWAVNVTSTIYDRAQLLVAGSTVTIKDSAGSGSTTVSIDATCPSVANYVLVSDASRFIVAFGTNDPTGVYATTAIDPMQIRWSDQESFATWTPSITNQAGDYRLSHGSAIYTAIQSRQEILVFTDSAVYSMQYLGAPYVWGFQLLEDNISLIGPNAVSVASNVVYWMGMDKFYVYTGRVQSMPCTLREYVFSDINLRQGFQVNSGTNEGYSEVWWTYCSSGSDVLNRYVIFDYLDNVWYYGTWNNYVGTPQGRTAWLDSSLRSFPMASAYGAPTLTSSRTQGSTTLVYHENGTDDAANATIRPIVAYVQSSDFDIGDGHNYGFVWRLIPDLTFDGSNTTGLANPYPSAYFTVRPRTFPGANYGASNDPAVTSAQNYVGQRTYAVQQFTQQVYVRIRGRQMAFKVSSGVLNDPLAGLGVQWQLGVPRIDIRPDGRR